MHTDCNAAEIKFLVVTEEQDVAVHSKIDNRDLFIIRDSSSVTTLIQHTIVDRCSPAPNGRGNENGSLKCV